MGFKTRELLHKTDWGLVKEHPEIMQKASVGKWLLKHDPEQYAAENFEKCADHMLHGSPFESTNSVPGYTYKPWTVHELLEGSDNGTLVEDEGDWS
jgi:hypothetical protein